MSEPPLRADARRNRARILAAAAEVFDEHGTSASTEEVARRAGVAVGTVFRHFPTKNDLLAAIMKDLQSRLTAEAEALAAKDEATALFTFFADIVEHAASTRTVIHLLAAAGTNVDVDRQLAALGETLDALLTRARKARTVHSEVRLDEVIALLTAACQGTLAAGWTPDLRRRTVARLLDGLRA
ncbi:TetR/AcrR family transcriptional regulator [Allokutzneria sp. A3M-2-11 16]|uniref:TetR/AcrR family transcriptional regulator n=1 Tax=Allokutzneria sp. A3M-2-11 16 TaxID=2962043 RepID=UPI0020B698BF|nr:TetR/AcrR family transcriptional regulator [Allokutzneria sp. A3M-2-11 16]MCP3801938.1 TetR/AcrR family transcriptional regulator [Allokutzneria sp. A3M-2-11 16]